MINGKRYAWEDVSIRLPHGLLLDVDSVEYSDKKEIEPVYGKGSNPRGYGSGNYSAEGKLTLLREEFNRLLDYAKSLGVTLYGLAPFPVTVSYANEDEPTTTDRLTGVKITEVRSSAGQGDQSVKVDLSIKILGGILWNGVRAN